MFSIYVNILTTKEEINIFKEEYKEKITLTYSFPKDIF